MRIVVEVFTILRTEKVIEEGTPPELLHNANPTINVPIPNEKEMRKSSAATSSSQDGSRKIGFTSPSSTNSPLPVNPLGLRWKGQPSISSSQLRIQSQQIMTSRAS
ncbi:hypothetical protein QN277_010399 [Acacia crassicarpa]|uniref:Uncharacterized protein n=1 Tax=Acacia crassicarpa TaxID=499986 RepID=A0AAE1M6M1_9FABA|nr:hypothetical protein QN277_010399 [Acacia crassicarpa]